MTTETDFCANCVAITSFIAQVVRNVPLVVLLIKGMKSGTLYLLKKTVEPPADDHLLKLYFAEV